MNDQEEIRFRAESTHDLPVHKEFQLAMTQTHPASLVGNFIVIISIITYFYLTYIHLDYPASFAKGFLGITFFYILFTYLPKLINRKGDIQYKRVLDANQGKPLRSVYEFTDAQMRINNADNSNSSTVEYSQLRKIILTKNLVILMMRFSQGFTISRSALNGQDNEFLCFLTERCSNLKPKRILKGTFGKILNWVKVALILAGVILAIWNLPFVQRLTVPNGHISNYHTCHEIADALEKFGLSGADPAMLDDMEAYHEEYHDYYLTENEKVVDVLYCMGCGSYDEDTWDWTPATGGVYWFDVECFALDTMYSDFLRGVSALDPELDFTNIQEDLSSVDLENNTGTQAATFCWQNQNYRIEGHVSDDWFDIAAADTLGDIIADCSTGKQLYFAYDNGQGCLVFYQNAQWATEFSKATGVNLYTSAQEMYNGID